MKSFISCYNTDTLDYNFYTMDINTFISYFLGTILVILGTSVVINKKFFKKVIKDMEKSPLSLYTSGIMGFFLGLFIVVNSKSFLSWEDSIITLL